MTCGFTPPEGESDPEKILEVRDSDNLEVVQPALEQELRRCEVASALSNRRCRPWEALRRPRS